MPDVGATEAAVARKAARVAAAVRHTRFTDIRWLAETDSTNRQLLDDARRGAPEGVVLAADHQVAGRGRLGRQWVAPPGSSLLVSILLRPELPLERTHLATVAVALAAADAVAQHARVRVALKWPNDLLSEDGRKLAGVLAEADLSGGRVAALVVGIGVNVRWPADLPADLAATAVSLNHLSRRKVTPADLLSGLLLALEPRCALLGEGPTGWARVVSEYRERCATIGQQVSADLGAETCVGRAVDVTEEGHLVVDTGAWVRTVAAGDVVHLRPAPPG